ncbi:MAG TPA: hypothetical protein DCQ29_04060 [Chitinophagaceae bacterium]|nr:hypothetical protein [Chitinophagaceae bacterium]
MKPHLHIHPWLHAKLVVQIRKSCWLLGMYLLLVVQSAAAADGSDISRLYNHLFSSSMLQQQYAHMLQLYHVPTTLGKYLLPDGTLPSHMQGSFNAQGYRLAAQRADGKLRFEQVSNTPTSTAVENNCNDGWDSRFGINNGAIGSLLAVAVDGSGNVYVGGSFSIAGSVVANNIAKWNGVTWEPLGAQQTINGNGVNGTVMAIAASGSKVYVGGAFSIAYNSMAVQVRANKIAVWDGVQWATLGTDATNGNGVNGLVNAIAVSGNKVFVGGIFTQVYNNANAAITANNIAVWNGTSWGVLGATGTANGVNGAVNALAVNGNTLWVGGAFRQAYQSGTTLQVNNIVAWSGTAWNRLGTGNTLTGNGVSDIVNTIAIGSNGKVYVGGNFTTAYNATGAAVTTNYIACWNGSSWSALGTGTTATGNGVNNAVKTIVVADSLVHAAGEFTNTYCGVATYNRQRIASWNGTTWLPMGGAQQNGATAGINAMCVRNSELFLVGNFSGVVASNGQTIAAGKIAVWRNNSWDHVDANIHNLGGYGLNGTIYTVAVKNNIVYVGGEFSMAYNSSNTVQVNNIAMWDGAQWKPIGNGANGTVNTIAIHNNDVYAGGWFSSVYNTNNQQVVANYIACWNGSTWSALGSSNSFLGNGVNGNVNTIVSYGNNLIVGGSFSNAYSSATNNLTVNNIAIWNGTTWQRFCGNDAGNGVNGEVKQVLVSNNNVYVAGAFTTALNASNTVVANRIAMWNGTTWISFGKGVNGTANSVAVVGDKVYVGGNFLNASNTDNTTVSCSKIAMWNGSVWQPLGDASLNGLNGNVISMSAMGNNVYVGGNFTTAYDVASAVTVNRIAVWTGEKWTTLSNGANATVNSIVAVNNRVHVGGAFNTMGCKISAAYALYYEPIIWRGVQSNQWSDARNWSPNAVPDSNSYVMIPDTANANEPVISQYAFAYNIAIGAARTLTINNNASLTVKGVKLYNDGVVRGEGYLMMNASFPQMITGVGTVQNIAINNTENVTVQSDDTLIVTGNYKPIAGSLYVRANITFTSTSSIANTNITDYIKGNVVTEQAIPAAPARRYLFVASPVQARIDSSWQQSIHITGEIGTCGTITANGFDGSVSGAPSMLTYNSNALLGTRWQSVANTNRTSIQPTVGYKLLVRGHRNEGCTLLSGTNVAASAVTLKAVGTLAMGNVAVTLQPNDFNLVGNPYISAIDFNTVAAQNSQHIFAAYWIQYPQNKPGIYTVYNAGTMLNKPSDVSNTNILPVGQAFTVRTKNTTTSISNFFTENNKANSLTANNNAPVWQGFIRVGLHTASNEVLDEMVIRFSNDNTVRGNVINNYDAPAMQEANYRIASKKQQQAMSIQTRDASYAIDTVTLNVVTLTPDIYILNFSDIQLPANGALLIDRFTRTETIVTNNMQYRYTVTNNVASQAEDRFQLVFRSASVLPVTFTSISAERQQAGALVTWSLPSDDDTKTYEVQRSNDARNYNTVGVVAANNSRVAVSYQWKDITPIQGKVYYRIKAVAQNDKTTLSAVVMVQQVQQNIVLQLYPNPVQHTLQVSFTKPINNNVQVVVVNANGAQVMMLPTVQVANQLQLPVATLPAGAYHLQIQLPDGTTASGMFVKQ